MTPTTGNLIEDLSAPSADRLGMPFLIVPGGTALTYGAFWDRVGRTSAALSASGAAPGERIVVQVDKSVNAVVLYAACLHAGAVHVPLNPDFTPDELDYFINDADPALVVARRDLVDGVADRHGVHVLSQDADGSGSLEDLATTAIARPAEPRAGNDLAALLYTSGTTGRPKGAALTHTNLRLNAWALHDAWRFDASDHLVHALPIFHVHGLFLALHCAMLSAIPVTFLPRFDADAVVAALRDATVFMGVPTQYNRLLASSDFDRLSCSSMRLFTAGSAPLPDSVFHEFTARTGHVICERYGMSETLITTTNPYEGARLAGTVGFAVPGVEMRVVDDDGLTVGPETIGGLEVRGEQVMNKYWRRPDATAQCQRAGGWFVTGDIAALDEQGRLTLQGRTTDLIISGGENIYPKELELALDSVPGIVESAVVGIPHPDLGEAVTALIVVGEHAPDDSTITQSLGASISRFKHPKKVIRLAELPRNSMGKIEKKALRELYSDLYSDPDCAD